MNIRDKIALVTGGSRGLGRNMALQLARNGADVLVTWHSRKDEAASVCAEIEALGRKSAQLQLDAAVISSFSSFSSQLNSLLREIWDRNDFDFLVNNAGIDVYSPFGQTTEKQFDNLLNIHFKGVYFLTQTLLPQIADGGRIICVQQD
jgi:NAD(P)-dependent dehydrogenase (short-subunit alcohol dehydrogenase family)